MLREARWSILDDEVPARQIRYKAAASRRGRRRGSASNHLPPDQHLEYRRWANAVMQDHQLLRQLLDRFDCAFDSRERASLFHLALEFHEAHQRFEHVWDPAPELGPRRLELDQATGLLEHLAPNTPAWNAMTRVWANRLRELMRREDEVYSDRPRPVKPFVPNWPSDLLECRLSLISEIRDVLQS